MTKPMDPLEEWASDVSYPSDGGPGAGQATKDNGGAYSTLIARGFRRNAFVAQHVNYWMNLVGRIAQWVLDGSSTGAADAHIVETDSDGRTALRGVELGPHTDGTTSALVIDATTGAATIGGAEITQDGAGANVVITSTSTSADRALVVTSASTAEPAVQINGSTGGGLEVDIASGTGVAATFTKAGNGNAINVNKSSGTGFAAEIVTAGSGGALSITDSGTGTGLLVDKNGNGIALDVDNVGGTSLAARLAGGSARGDLNLVPRAGTPSAPSDGDIWHANSGELQLRHYSGSQQRRILETENVPQIRGSQNTSSTATSSTSTASPGTTRLTSTSQAYPSGHTILILWMASASAGTTGASVVLELADITAGTTIDSVSLAVPDAPTTGAGLSAPMMRVVAYTIPSAASRQFRIRFFRSGGSGTVYVMNGTILVLSDIFQAVI